MSTKQIGVNIKKGVIKFLKTCSISYLIIPTILMFSLMSQALINSILELDVPEDVKNEVWKYIIFTNIAKYILPNPYIRWAIFIISVIILSLSWYIRYCYEESVEKSKKIISILGHSTLGKSQFKLDEETTETVQLKLEELNLIEDMIKVEGDSARLKYIVSRQDDFIKSFKDKFNNSDNYGYMGISHTPLILRAGYQIGDETKFTMFHKKRYSSHYEALSESNIYAPIKIQEKNIRDDSKELIVAISTTFEIQDNQLSILQPDNKSIIKFKTDELDFDVITSRIQVEEYVSFILKEIRQVVAREDIIKIHMIISSSVAFTFTIGQTLSNNYDREVIVYHFDINNPKIYPWGISLFKDANNCIVTN